MWHGADVAWGRPVSLDAALRELSSGIECGMIENVRKECDRTQRVVCLIEPVSACAIVFRLRTTQP